MYSMIYLTTRGATLIHDRNRALIGIPLYSRQLTYALRRRILGSLHPLTAPSAVHLTVRFLPAFQRRGLSGRAWPPLSPLQRFGVYEFTIIILHAKLSVNPSESLVLLERNGCCNFQNAFAGRGRPLFIQLAVCYNMDHHFCQGGCDFS